MKKILVLLLILTVLFFLVKGWWSYQLAPIGTDKITRDIVIQKGQSLSKIADQLKKESLIRSPLVFNLYVRQKGLSSKLQAGLFRLSPSMSTEEIVTSLTRGPEGIWVRLQEGWRVEEMAEELNSKFEIRNSKFLAVAKEGYMFPDSYLFPREAIVSLVVDTLRDTFERRFSQDLRSKIKSQSLTEEQGVIIASIVEREARSDKVRQMVASILLKRYKIGMGLNADATLQYALGFQKQEKSWWKRHLTSEDKKVDSPFNTYLHSGLPPAPICNPSVSSLQAVANADSSTPYLYYYHDSKGNSHYAKTLEEHNQNVNNYP